MILLQRDRILRTIKRMAYQIVEESRGGQICIIGLNVRGFSVAELLYSDIQKETDYKPQLLQLNADDDSVFKMPETVNTNATIVLVDDVIFSGVTMYRAMQKITGLSEYKKVIVATLVDRGHRRLPVQSKITGFHVPTKLNEHVELVVEKNNPEKVILTNKIN